MTQAPPPNSAPLPEPRPRRERTQNAAKRRRQIIEATIDSIVTRGLSGTTLATVAQAAGLSQGVAVFYFKTKESLLTETLRAHYEEYRMIWREALESAGADPVAQIRALISADFDIRVCNRRMLALWYAFWGEAKARPLIARLSTDYDGERDAAMRAACAAAHQTISDSGWTPELLAEALDGLSDGLWLKLHLSEGEFDLGDARRTMLAMVRTVFPLRHPGAPSQNDTEPLTTDN